MKIKIYGCGSIGNHMAHAARRLGWGVVMVDVDRKAMVRTQKEIYPARYGRWDSAIQLFVKGTEPQEGFDLIHIGTPPLSHVPLAMECLREKPRGILIEKPLCEPALRGLSQLAKLAETAKTKFFVGYDHVVGQAAQFCGSLLKRGYLGPVQALDVEFREFWGGIFQAHPWLRGPQDSYLGFWKKGGGAGGEHSHALNLWQFFSRCAGMGKITGVSALLQRQRTRQWDYDAIFSLQLQTSKGLTGRVIQDVVTRPAKKWARIQGSQGFLEWHGGTVSGGGDRVIFAKNGRDASTVEFSKTRPDDFIRELQHLRRALHTKPFDSPLRLERGIETMKVIQAAYESDQSGKVIKLPA